MKHSGRIGSLDQMAMLCLTYLRKQFELLADRNFVNIFQRGINPSHMAKK